jgi:hypothetical protein
MDKTTTPTSHNFSRQHLRNVTVRPHEFDDSARFSDWTDGGDFIQTSRSREKWICFRLAAGKAIEIEGYLSAGMPI